METEKAIEILKKFLNGKEDVYKFLELNPAIETVLNQLTKQEKMIELMAEYIMYKVPFTKETRCLELKEDARTLNSVKQYFENKANEEAE